MRANSGNTGSEGSSARSFFNLCFERPERLEPWEEGLIPFCNHISRILMLLNLAAQAAWFAVEIQAQTKDITPVLFVDTRLKSGLYSLAKSTEPD